MQLWGTWSWLYSYSFLLHGITLQSLSTALGLILWTWIECSFSIGFLKILGQSQTDWLKVLILCRERLLQTCGMGKAGMYVQTEIHMRVAGIKACDMDMAPQPLHAAFIILENFNMITLRGMAPTLHAIVWYIEATISPWTKSSSFATMLLLSDSNKQVHLSTEWHSIKISLCSTYPSNVGLQCSLKPVSSTMSQLHVLRADPHGLSPSRISIRLAWRATWAETEVPWKSADYIITLSVSQCLPRFAEQGRPNTRMAQCMMVNSWMTSVVAGVCKCFLTSPRMRASGRMTRCKVQAPHYKMRLAWDQYAGAVQNSLCD